MTQNYNIYIDCKAVDISKRSAVSLSFEPDDILILHSSEMRIVAKMALPSTPLNDDILLYSNQLASAYKFNSEPHSIVIESDGAVVARGIARLDSFNANANEYHISVVDEAALQLQCIDNKLFSELFPDFEMLLSGANIAKSWTANDAIVRYLPVARAVYLSDYSTVSLLPPDQPMTTANYHPFLHLRQIIERIFSDAGYSICSEFMAGELFNLLYISGLYQESDVRRLIERMDFRAGRFGVASAVGDSMGYVYANPQAAYNSLGNLVETASAIERKDGVAALGVYDNGGCVCIDNQRINFKPKQPVTVAIRYKLSLTTAYQIVSRERLEGFDTIILGGGDVREFGLSNPFEDRRDSVHSGQQYRVIPFGAMLMDSWRIVVETNTVIASFTGISAIVTLTSNSFANLRLQRLNIVTMQYADYDGDWVLYDGYVDYQGVTDVELDIFGKPELITPSSPKYFDAVAFAGGWSGAQLTLRDAVITPIFEPHPTENTTIHWGDIAAHKFSCSKLLEAVNQMFNLRYFIDKIGKKIYVEPYDNFYTGAELDWSSKIEYSKPLIIEPASGIGNSAVRFGYRSGDGASELINRNLALKFGDWRVDDDCYFAKPAERSIRNALFTPTVNYDYQSATAPSARLPMCGDVKTEWDSSLNFEPKIVVYKGVRQLPAGEHWGYPTFGNGYPYAAFHAPGEWTLCMDDMDSCNGLKRFWQSELDGQKEAKKLTLWLHLDGVDVEPFREPNALKRDWRAKFKFWIDGECGYYRISTIEDYNPDEGIAKCSFMQIINYKNDEFTQFNAI